MVLKSSMKSNIDIPFIAQIQMNAVVMKYICHTINTAFSFALIVLLVVVDTSNHTGSGFCVKFFLANRRHPNWQPIHQVDVGSWSLTGEASI